MESSPLKQDHICSGEVRSTRFFYCNITTHVPFIPLCLEGAREFVENTPAAVRHYNPDINFNNITQST